MGILDNLLTPQGQPGLGNLDQNTLFQLGMGILAAQRDPQGNPFQGALAGIQRATQARTAAEAAEEKRLERENLANLRESASGLIGDYTATGHPGLEDMPGAALSPEQRQIAGMYEQMAQYGDPTKAATGFVDYLGDAGIMGGAGGDVPKSVAEWNFYSSLPEEQQKRYLEMKRGQQIMDIAGEKVRIFGDLTEDDILSTLPEELAAKAKSEGAGAMGVARAGRLNELELTRQQRASDAATAAELLAKVRANDLPTGQYTGLLYKVLPTTDQEKLDALAMSVTRMKLKAAGERQTTDNDVRMMLRATFGSSSTEDFNRAQLESLIRDIESMDRDYNALTAYFDFLPGMPAPVTADTQQQGGGILEPDEADSDTETGEAVIEGGLNALEEAERRLKEAGRM